LPRSFLTDKLFCGNSCSGNTNIRDKEQHVSLKAFAGFMPASHAVFTNEVLKTKSWDNYTCCRGRNEAVDTTGIHVTGFKFK
jgi:hypothetical protein